MPGTIKISASNFAAGSMIRYGYKTFGIGAPFYRRKRSIGEVTELTVVNYDGSTSVGGTIGGGLIGGFALGEAGAIAGAVIGSRKSAIHFSVVFKDGARFLGSCPAKLFTELHADAQMIFWRRQEREAAEVDTAAIPDVDPKMQAAIDARVQERLAQTGNSARNRQNDALAPVPSTNRGFGRRAVTDGRSLGPRASVPFHDDNSSRLRDKGSLKFGLLTAAVALLVFVGVIGFGRAGKSTAAPDNRSRTEQQQASMKVDNTARQQAWLLRGQDAVKQLLRDPASAQFRNSFFSRAGGVPVACGEVNAKNAFGGYGDYERYISAGDPKITYLEEQVSDFQVAWNKFCTR